MVRENPAIKTPDKQSDARSNDIINVMVVDDSAVIRNLFVGALEQEDNIRIAATARNGQIAIDHLKNKTDEIDVIILDIQMPIKDGLEALPEILRISPTVKVIMASTLSISGAKETMEALSKGAADYLAKPDKSDKKALYSFVHELVNKVQSFGRLTSPSKQPQTRKEVKPTFLNKNHDFTLQNKRNAAIPQALAIGSSTGGPQALSEIFTNLRGKQLSAPLFITQHMPAEFTPLLAKQLSDVSGLDVREGQDGEEVQFDRIYLAPGGFHMLVSQQDNKVIIKISDSPAENYCRPAVDPMLRSMIEVYGNQILLMILTGMGADGCKGAQQLVDAGGIVIAQDEQTSVVWGMPGAVAMAGLCSYVLPIKRLSSKYIELAQGKIR